MTAYETYKPAALPWLDEIPTHWDAQRIKFHYKEIENRSLTGDEEMLSVSHITGVTPRSQKNVNMFLSESNVGQKVIQPGDIAVNTMWAWMAAMGVSKFSGIVSPSYGVYRPIAGTYNPAYLDYLLRIEKYRAEYVRRSTGVTSSRLRLYPDKFLDIRFPFPPIQEQDHIVRYLGWKVSQVNKLINAKRKQIELLQEKKRVVVNDEVTRGGEGWKGIRFKFLTLCANTGVSITKDYWHDGGDLLLYTAGQKPIRASYSKFPTEWLTSENDILVARNGAGSIHIPVSGAVYTDHVIRFVLARGVNRKFVYYSLLIGMQKVVNEANTVSLATLNKSDWEQVVINLPSEYEQRSIVMYLDKKCEHIDKIVEKLNDELSLFAEYRTRLISDVVTGKLDVRSVVVPEYEMMDSVSDDIEETEVEETED